MDTTTTKPAASTVKNEATPAVNNSRFIKSDEAMRLFHYSDKCAFWQAVHRDSIPHIRQNSRRILFERAALEAWFARRTIGGRAV